MFVPSHCTRPSLALDGWKAPQTNVELMGKVGRVYITLRLISNILIMYIQVYSHSNNDYDIGNDYDCIIIIVK